MILGYVYLKAYQAQYHIIRRKIMKEQKNIIITLSIILAAFILYSIIMTTQLISLNQVQLSNLLKIISIRIKNLQ